jgi:hypothetical protein
MVGNPLDTRPPDDTGSDTLRRFHYQACLTVPYCLKCAAGEGIVSVITEHFEDIVVEYEDSWLFIQVKTRNASRGPWRLTDAITGLKSLYRAFQRMNHLTAVYSLHIEGSMAVGDILEELVPDKSSLSADLRRRVAKGLEISESDCDRFLANIIVRPDQPPREHVVNHNLRIFSEYAPSLPRPELEAVHEALINKVLEAMVNTIPDTLIPGYIEDANALQEDMRSQVEAKRLTQEHLVPILEPIVSGGYLLHHRTIQEGSEQTKLEQKLIAGGAQQNVVRNAKQMRANASEREYERLAAALYDDERLDDVRMRLQVLANAIVQKHSAEDKPVAKAWAELLGELQASPETFDPHRVYDRNPFLLLGAVCDLTDECVVDWGAPLA